MNRKIKILLSVMIVSLSAFFVPLMGQSINNKIDSATVMIVETEPQLYPQQNIMICVEEVKKDYETAVEEMNMKMEEIDSISDIKEWFLSYKTIVEEYENIIDPPETIYDYFSENELDLLFRVVQAEIGDKYSFTQKVNVASVIFNRLNHEKFPNTISDILIPSQFATISDGRYKKVEVSEATILACEYAFEIADTTDGCLFFDSNNKLKYEFIYNDGAHNFYKIKGE